MAVLWNLLPQQVVKISLGPEVSKAEVRCSWCPTPQQCPVVPIFHAKAGFWSSGQMQDINKSLCPFHSDTLVGFVLDACGVVDGKQAVVV